MKSSVQQLRKLHSISSLGNVTAAGGDVRAERLQDRLTPKVPFPHKHNFYQIVIVKAGQGYHEIDFKIHPISCPHVFILKPGQVHSWKLNRSTQGYIVEFTTESFHGSLSNSLDEISRFKTLQEELTIDKSGLKRLEHVLENMVIDTAIPNRDSTTYLQRYLSILLIELSRLQKNGRKLADTLNNLTIRFIDLVEESYKKERNLEYYAKRLGVSIKVLAQTIRNSLSETPKLVIRNRCILEAKRLLAYSPLTVAQIGYEIGFEDPNYFSRFFIQSTGMKAQTFRDVSNAARTSP